MRSCKVVTRMRGNLKKISKGINWENSIVMDCQLGPTTEMKKSRVTGQFSQFIQFGVK